MRLTEDGRKWVEQTLTSLPLEEKVGQMLQVPYYADYKGFDTAAYRAIRSQLQKYHLGSLILSAHFNGSSLLRVSPSDAARVANQLQSDSKLPLLLAEDMERGVASRLNDAPAFPWPMAFGAVNDPSEVERFAAIAAKDARAIGIQWALAPVADVNGNPNNPIINNRSFGEDPEQVGAMVAAFIRGAHENGLLVTAKHFPGHGDTSEDSHRTVPSIDGDLAHLEKFEFLPFRKAVEAGVDSILLAHARVPAVEPDPNKVATISFKVVTGVLRGQLGFKGVVLTDGLEMRGLSSLYPRQEGNPGARAAVDAIKAGGDVIMVLVPSDLDSVFHAIVAAVRSGEIPESRIDESVRKILRMKASVGLNESRLVNLEQVAELVSKREDIDFAQHVADEAVTLVRDNGVVLPLRRAEESVSDAKGPGSGSRRAEHRLVVVVLTEAIEGSSGHEFQRAIEARRADAAFFYVDSRVASAVGPEVLKAVNEAEKVVVAAFIVRGPRPKTTGSNLVDADGALSPSGLLLQQMLAVAPRKVAVIALGSPYLIESFPEVRTYLCTYAMAGSSQIGAAKALFGEVHGGGKLPVTLPGVASRGFSLPWPTHEKSHVGNLRTFTGLGW